MFEVWEGDLFLYYVDNPYDADLAREEGFTVKELNRA